MVRALRFAVALAFLCIAAVTAEEDDERPPPEYGPLADNYTIIANAAQRSLDVYSMTPGDAGNGELMEATMYDGQVKSAVWFEETNDFCYATFRGVDQGFGWVANMTLDLSRVHVRDKRKKKCRVVKHYKDLYFNIDHSTGYKERLDDLLFDCWSSGKTVIFAGHDLGGALATLAALEYAEMDQWTITFGQPPVFMPPQYKNPGNLYPKAKKKNPCKFIEITRYIPFVNMEIFGEIAIFGTPYYDYMVFLNVLIYGLIDSPPSNPDHCLSKAAARTDAFLADDNTRGNLGSQFGRRYLFSPTLTATVGNTNNYINFLRYPPSRRNNDFIFQGNQGVTLSMINADPALFQGDCSAPIDIHSMEAYVEKVKLAAPNDQGNPGFEPGFPQNEVCNVRTDCAADDCNIGSLGTGICPDPEGARVTRFTKRAKRKNK